MARLLVVEGTASVRESVRMILGAEHDVALAATPGEGIALAGRASPDLVLAGGPAGSGRRPADRPSPWLEALRRGLPGAPRVRPLPLPFAVADLRGAVRRALGEPPDARPVLPPTPPPESREGDVPAYLAALDPEGALARRAERAAGTTLPVLITGERGTGRETVARWLHATGPLAAGPFAVFACAGLDPAGLSARLGRLPERGVRPTLFLKRLDDASPALQEALLALVESGTPAVRVIAAASDALGERVEAGLVAEPLVEALGVITLPLPPLRERPGAIAGLAARLLERGAREAGLPRRRLSSAAEARLALYCWPGNLRELAGVLARSAALAEGETLGPEEIEFGLGATPPASPQARTVRGQAPAARPAEPAERVVLDPAPAGSASSRLSDAPEAPGADSHPDFLAMAAELAHELKNPLVAIKTFTQLLGEKFDDPEFRREFYRVVRRDVERIDHLVEAILEAAGAAPAQPAFLALGDLVEEVLARSEAWMVERRVVPFRELAAGLPRAVADPRLARAALFNVVARALASSPAGEDLFVATYGGDPLRVVVAFHDQSPVAAAGPGADELELALARVALGRGGGRLRVDRDASSRRTTVTLEFRPANVARPPQPAERPLSA